MKICANESYYANNNPYMMPHKRKEMLKKISKKCPGYSKDGDKDTYWKKGPKGLIRKMLEGLLKGGFGSDPDWGYGEEMTKLEEEKYCERLLKKDNPKLEKENEKLRKEIKEDQKELNKLPWHD